MNASPSNTARQDTIADAIVHASHLLPQQAPLHAFVHHNTLHHFEAQPFCEAVENAARAFGAEPYHQERAYKQAFQHGRIQLDDIQAALTASEARLAGDPMESIFPGGPSLRIMRLACLQTEVTLPTAGGYRWWLQESDTLCRFHKATDVHNRSKVLEGVHETRQSVSHGLAALWEIIANVHPSDVAPTAKNEAASASMLPAELGPEVQEFLIRFLGAYLDQGISYWPMPRSENGLLATFRELYGQRGILLPRWAAALPSSLRAMAGREAVATVDDLLNAAGVPNESTAKFIERLLLSMPGWPGMVVQFEQRPDKAPVKAPKVSLEDYVAIALTLQAEAAKAAQSQSGFEVTSSDDEGAAADALVGLRAHTFYAAQWLGVAPSALDQGDNAQRFLDAMSEFNEVNRRRILHLAYERRHRISVLDPLLAFNGERKPQEPDRPMFQAVFCIDDREESLRRHLEEVEPRVQTFGYAGYYALPMAYLALGSAHPQPLCPVSIIPRHVVVEVGIDQKGKDIDHWHPAAAGALLHQTSTSSRTLVRGSVISALVGSLEVIPLIGHVLFPRLAERAMAKFRGTLTRIPTRTHLVVEHPEQSEKNGTSSSMEAHVHGMQLGFTLQEMTDAVYQVLTETGLHHHMARLVLIVGHGSSSLNNPQEAAHDCGACSGGPGGPNARAFAQMANLPAVRAELLERGLKIPDDTVFVGGFHNTANDAVPLYDLEEVAASHRALLQEAQQALEEARRRDAQERIRRFPFAPASTQAALSHVQARAVDLAQPRPEYGHCTNAVCVVGRRALTRGLFMDRRAFLVSYDPSLDEDGSVLDSLLQSVVPVGAGINLEYYFSFIDNERYGSGTKLPHNITGLHSVMNGPSSDLRTGLPWQMVEVHEPVRMLTIIEASPERLADIAQRRPAVGRLIENQWVQLIAWDPATNVMLEYVGPNAATGEAAGFVPYHPEETKVHWVQRSVDHYAGQWDHLSSVGIIDGALPDAEQAEQFAAGVAL